MAEAADIFSRAVQLAHGEFYVAAIEQFRRVTEMESGEGLPDDAQYNIGLCFFKMNAFDRAKTEFQRVIDEYPDATIATDECPGEIGKTAAKAHLGLLMCALATGDRTEADAQMEALLQYPESYVVDEAEGRRTFHQLGEELIENYEDGAVVEA